MNANWPIRVGGIYLLTGREPLALRVRALDGETVHYIHVMTKSGRFAKGDEFGVGATSDFSFRSQCQPEDQSPLPELLEALKGVLPYMEQAESAGLVGDEGCHWPVELVRAAIAKAEAK